MPPSPSSVPQLVAISIATMLVCARVGLGVITLDASYDEASLKSYSVTSGSSTPTVNLVGRSNYFGNNEWRWLNFKTSGVLNVRPTFSISNNFAGGSSELATQAMVYSYDNVNWNFFDNNVLGSSTFTFSNNTPFTSANVYVAYATPYSYGMSVAHTQQVLSSPYARPTVSGDANGVIGQSPGGVDDLGRTIAPRNIYAYHITNPASDSPTRPKMKVVISTGLHANEVLGTHTYQGLVDFLLSNDPRAVVLRGVADFYCYPTLNPDGRFAGNNRSTVENVNQDPNGLWNPSLWPTHKEIMVNGTSMIADTRATPGSGIDAFIDFHSTVPSDPGDDFGFLEYEQGDNLVSWWQTFKQLQPNVKDTDSTGNSWTTANFAEAFLGAKVDETFETQFGTRRTKAFYNNEGRNFGLAFAKAWEPTHGDTNFDGSVNFDDLLTLARHYGQLTGATWEQGDFSYDGDVDFADLLGLAAHYNSMAAAAFSATVLDGVSTSFKNDWALAASLLPEPTSALVGIAALAGCSRRVRRVSGID